MDITTNEALELVRAYRRYIEHLAGKHNQKSHGNKYGSTDAIRGNVKRLGGDKAALVGMAKKARGDKDFRRETQRALPPANKDIATLRKMDSQKKMDLMRSLIDEDHLKNNNNGLFVNNFRSKNGKVQATHKDNYYTVTVDGKEVYKAYDKSRGLSPKNMGLIVGDWYNHFVSNARKQ